uniref:L-serine ammonia-lyase n=1 Tax=Neogobius melanostomus TaxID=47308 RepID=A0A8C6V0U2_9GOBI
MSDRGLTKNFALSKVAGTSVYLKLDSSQPTGSFKIRGIGHLCKTVMQYLMYLVPTGGNAGTAAAYSARQLLIPATIVVPSVTPGPTVERLKDEADVVIYGKVVDYGQQLFGHTSLVKELEQDLREKPGAVVLSVGGGGLLNGVVEGLRRAGWNDVPIVAMETIGAHSLNAAMKAGELVTLPEITSVATTLGLTRVSKQTMKLVQEHTVFSELVTDQAAVKAVERFVDDEKILVEPACGAALAAVYCDIIKRLQDEDKLAKQLGPVVIVVCGGNNISMEQLWRLKKQLAIF